MSASNAVLSKSPATLLSDFLLKKYEQEKTIGRYIQGNIRSPTVDIHHPPLVRRSQQGKNDNFYDK